MSIQPLPGDVVAQIKSSIAITSLNGAVCGLLRNSLDAAASKVNISVDYSRGYCSVEDNGHGITPASFQEEGGLGRLHCVFFEGKCALDIRLTWRRYVEAPAPAQLSWKTRGVPRIVGSPVPAFHCIPPP